ncbi:HD domain-containing protein [Halobacillus campisalis]|uniref:HD domain-containing protein n=1 Tax=Halobacillus campisalis TaxID=435909 RepID=A0ABW2K3E6_9BACI|nr:HD domain-containing protein [Halobacillus campisalis]
MNQKNVIQAIKKLVHEHFAEDPTGHDYYHMDRVAKWSLAIAHDEGADLFVAEAAGWLHDIGDAKLFDHPETALEELRDFLLTLQLNEQKINDIFAAIQDVSFSKGTVPETLEGKIVQDADRLDALGAIGIARTFAYGGSHKQLLHSDQSSTSIQHFYDKLLTLSSNVHTPFAKKEADKRHKYMLNYLEQFFEEWNTEGI